MSRSAARDSQALPLLPVRMAFWFFCAVTLALILALTPFTHMLDDVKIWIMHVGGAALLVVFLALRLGGLAPGLPRAVAWSWGAFILANVLSTLVAAWPFLFGATWPGDGSRELNMAHARVVTGIDSTWFYAALTGFVFCGASVLQTRRMVVASLKFWIIAALITTAFGLFHYGGGFGPVYDYLKASFGGDSSSRLLQMAYTFAVNREMLSTILNTQFFGNFLVMVMPAAAAATAIYAADAARRRSEDASAVQPLMWLVAAAVSTFASLACIWFTYQKSSLLLFPVVIVAFIFAMQRWTEYRIVRVPQRWLLAACFVGSAVFLYWLTRADFATRLISLERSIEPRRIIFGAAWQQFLDYPVFGAGPGSFRLLFTTYRAPDFHLHRIANVTTFSHNWLLDQLSEVGILGAGAYTIFLVVIYRLGWRAIRTSPDHAMRIAVIGYLTGLASILIGNLATPMSRWPVGAGSLHAFAGLAVAVIGVAFGGAAAPAQRRPGIDAGRAVLVGAAVLALAFFVITLRSQNNSWRANRIHSEALEYLTTIDRVAGELSATELRRYPKIRDVLADSIALFREAIALDPFRPTSYYKLGYAYNRHDDLEDAIATYRQLQLFSPDYSEVHYNLGMMLLARAVQHEAAAKDAAALAEVEQNYAQALDELRTAGRQSTKINVQRKLAYGLTIYAEHLGREQGAAAAREAGEILDRAAASPIGGDWEERLRETEARSQALREAPRAWRLAGDRGRLGAALERVVHEYPDDSQSLTAAYFAYVAAGDEERARRIAREAIGKNPLEPLFQMLMLDQARLAGKNEARAYAVYLLEVDKRTKGFLDDKSRQTLVDLVEGRERKDDGGGTKGEDGGMKAAGTTSGTLGSEAGP